jgi:ribosomal protein S8
MNNSIIKNFSKLKNASCLGKEIVFLNTSLNSSLKLYLNFLYNEGLIQGFNFDSKNLYFIVRLRFFQQKPLITTIKIFSTPFFNYFISFAELNFLSSRAKLFLFSTNKGLLILLECKKQRVGGKLLFYVN